MVHDTNNINAFEFLPCFIPRFAFSLKFWDPVACLVPSCFQGNGFGLLAMFGPINWGRSVAICVNGMHKPSFGTPLFPCRVVWCALGLGGIVSFQYFGQTFAFALGYHFWKKPFHQHMANRWLGAEKVGEEILEVPIPFSIYVFLCPSTLFAQLVCDMTQHVHPAPSAHAFQWS